MDGERPQHLPTTVSLNPWPITPIFECPPTRRTSRTRSSQCSTIATLKALLRSSLWRTPPAVGRSWRDREIGRLLETADAGDVLVAAEVSRLARSTLQVLELLQAAADRGVTVHIAKNRMVLDQSLPATITATILGSRRRSSGNLSRPGRKRRSRAAKQRDFPSVDRKAEPRS